MADGDMRFDKYTAAHYKNIHAVHSAQREVTITPEDEEARKERQRKREENKRLLGGLGSAIRVMEGDKSQSDGKAEEGTSGSGSSGSSGSGSS